MDVNNEDQENATSVVLSEATETVDDGCNNTQLKQQNSSGIENDQFDKLLCGQELPAAYSSAHEEASKGPQILTSDEKEQCWLVKETNNLSATESIGSETVSEHKSWLIDFESSGQALKLGNIECLSCPVIESLTGNENIEKDFEDVCDLKRKVEHNIIMTSTKEEQKMVESLIVIEDLPAPSVVMEDPVTQPKNHDEDVEQEATKLSIDVIKSNAVPLEALVTLTDLTVTSENPVILQESHLEDINQTTTTKSLFVKLEDGSQPDLAIPPVNSVSQLDIAVSSENHITLLESPLEDVQQSSTGLPLVDESTTVPLEVLITPPDLTVTSENHLEVLEQATTNLPNAMIEDITVHSENPTISPEFLERIQFLEHLVDSSLDQMKVSLKQDYQSVKKILDEILETETKTLQEMTSKADILKSSLHFVASVAPSEIKAASNTLDYLEACFNRGHWLEKSVKLKNLPAFKELMKDFVTVEYGGVAKVNSIIDQHLHGVMPTASDLSQESVGEASGRCDPFLVTVSHVIDPGEFYVVRMCDAKRRHALFSTLKEAASTYPVPKEIVSGTMYAVLNTGLNWYRGVCQKICGLSQVGDKPPEIIHQFFLLDQGHYEHIPASSVRVLPFQLYNIPPMARECKLNHNFECVPWSVQSVAAFKQMVKRGPMNMKVFKEEGGILEVDLAQLPCFGEESNIVSVRDALFFSYRPPCNEVNQKFKPKYGSHNLGLGQQEPKQLVVRVCCALSPMNIYVHVLDEELLRFHLVHQEMQTELNSGAAESVPQPQKGFAYAVQNNRQWYRVLAEEILVEQNRLSVFYVDTGHRQYVNNGECFKLPERFMEIPAQAVRCVLDGVHHLGKRTSQWNKPNRAQLWPRDVSEILRSYNEKKAVVFLEKLLSGEVGKGSAKELTACVVMYVEGERSCVNHKLGRSNLTYSSKRHERPDHSAIRLELFSSYKSYQLTFNSDFRLKALDILTDPAGSGINVLSTNASATSSAPLTPECRSPVPEHFNCNTNLRSRLSSTNSITSTELYGRDSSIDVDHPSCSRKENVVSGYDQSTDGAANQLFVRTVPTVDVSPLLAQRPPRPNLDSLTVNFSVDGVPGSVDSITKYLSVQQSSSTNNVSFENVNAANQASSSFPDPWNSKYTHENVLLADSLKNLSETLVEPPEEMSSKSQDVSISDMFQHRRHRQEEDVTSKFTLPVKETSRFAVYNVSSKDQLDKARNIQTSEVSLEKIKKTAGADADVIAVKGTQPGNETGTDVSFSWCDSPNAIYFRTDEMEDGFRDLRRQMQIYYKNVELPNVRNFEVGFRCAVFTDTKWWRAEVTCLDNYPECEVCLVDTGYQRKVLAQEIRPLASEFDSIRRLTWKCSLENVYPPPSGNWEENTITFINERLTGSKGITVFRRGEQKNKYDPTIISLLYIYNLDGGPLEFAGMTRINLNEELVENGLAYPRPGLATSLLRPVPNLPPIREWKTADHSGISVNQVFWGSVTWVNVAGEIFLHDVKASPKLAEMEKWLNNHYNSTEPTEADLRCRQGDLCIAKYSNNSWYRGIVRDIDAVPGKMKVFFIDYGTLDAVSRCDIRLNIMLEDTPVQAIRCVLDNVRPTKEHMEGNGKWSIGALDILHKWIVDKEFRVIVKNKGPPLRVKLTGHQTSKPIADQLVAHKLAEYITAKKKKGKKMRK